MITATATSVQHQRLQRATEPEVLGENDFNRTIFFYKKSGIKLPKIQKKQVQIRMWSYDKKIGLRLPYRIADVIETNATSYMDIFGIRT